MNVTAPEMVLVWFGFGVAAAMVAMILPYRRGVIGVSTNLLLGILSSILGGIVGSWLHTRRVLHDPGGLGMSAAVSVFVLGLFHAAWLWLNPREPARDRLRRPRRR